MNKILRILNSLSGFKRLGLFLGSPFFISSVVIIFLSLFNFIYQGFINKYPTSEQVIFDPSDWTNKYKGNPSDQFTNTTSETRNAALPDGTIIENIPKNFSKEMLLTKLHKKNLKEKFSILSEELWIGLILTTISVFIFLFFFGLEWVIKGFKGKE